MSYQRLICTASRKKIQVNSVIIFAESVKIISTSKKYNNCCRSGASQALIQYGQLYFVRNSRQTRVRLCFQSTQLCRNRIAVNVLSCDVALRESCIPLCLRNRVGSFVHSSVQNKRVAEISIDFIEPQIASYLSDMREMYFAKERLHHRQCDINVKKNPRRRLRAGLSMSRYAGAGVSCLGRCL